MLMLINVILLFVILIFLILMYREHGALSYSPVLRKMLLIIIIVECTYLVIMTLIYLLEFTAFFSVLFEQYMRYVENANH